MKIAVCVKAVPDAASGRRIDPSTNRLDRSGELTISDWDTYPVEEALKLKEAAGEGEVVVVSMGPERAMDALRKALAMGADRAVLVSDAALEGPTCSAPRRRSPARSSRRAPISCSSASSRPTAAARACGPRSPSGCAGRSISQVSELTRRRLVAHGQAPDGVRLRHDPRAAARGRRGRRLDQHAALSVAEGDHGREEEAAGHARGAADVGGAEGAGTTVVALSPPPRAARRARSTTTASGAEKIVEFLAEKRLV